MKVSQETCRLAKEKGYTNCGCGVGYPDCVCKGECWFIEQWELQKWLREKHEIVVSNHVWEYLNGFSYNALIWEKEMDDEHKHINPMSYYSWEESLEEGLKYALNLIK